MFDPINYAELAKELPGDLKYDKEARTRASVSRAYYALFLATRTAIRRAQGVREDGVGDKVAHGALPTALYATKDTKLAAIAKLLQEAYDGRICADYQLLADRAVVRKPRDAENLARRVEIAIKKSLGDADFSLVVD